MMIVVIQSFGLSKKQTHIIVAIKTLVIFLTRWDHVLIAVGSRDSTVELQVVIFLTAVVVADKQKDE